MKRRLIPLAIITTTATAAALTAPATAAESPSTEYVWATEVTANEVHMKARGKSCPEDFTLAKAKETHKVTWKYPQRTGEKTLKKGTFACMFTGKNGVTEQGTFNKDGVLVALPSNFPKNPTAEDIKSLGLTPDTKVDPELRMPKPKMGSEFAAPVLPEKVEPVATHQDKIFEVYVPSHGYWDIDYSTKSGDREWVHVADARTDRYFPVEVEYRGGEGVLMVRGAYDPATDSMVKYKAYELAPDKVTTVYQMMSAPTEESGYQNDYTVINPGDGSTGSAYFHAGGFIAPDYGQADLPATMLDSWGEYEDDGGIYERRARLPYQPKQSMMSNVGRWANASRVVYGEPKDGFAWITEKGNIHGASGAIIEDYTYSVKGPHPLPWENRDN